ncbi:hypothetical protein ACVWZV_001156 [Bradyrhizobium sp. GM5.1]
MLTLLRQQGIANGRRHCDRASAGSTKVASQCPPTPPNAASYGEARGSRLFTSGPGFLPARANQSERVNITGDVAASDRRAARDARPPAVGAPNAVRRTRQRPLARSGPRRQGAPANRAAGDQRLLEKFESFKIESLGIRILEIESLENRIHLENRILEKFSSRKNESLRSASLEFCCCRRCPSERPGGGRVRRRSRFGEPTGDRRSTIGATA